MLESREHMLDQYFLGTLPQILERAKLLKAKIPRTLPRDYGALIKTCEVELADIMARLRELQNTPLHGSTAISHAQLRKFKRLIADLDRIETRAIPALNRVHSDDHHANRLLFRICQEISYPLIPPTVTTLSKGYFYIDTKLQLLFIPLAEGSFLLHLPDLYHELCHPLLTHQDHPVLDKMRSHYLECVAQVHDHFNAERAKEALRRGPSAFKDQGDLWEHLWSKYWLTEFFCDLFAVVTLGPAFVWSHLHLYLKTGGQPFRLPNGIQLVTHPADDARMRAMLEALVLAGFREDAAQISARWRQALELTAEPAPADYHFCYPHWLIKFIVDQARAGTLAMDCRPVSPNTSEPIQRLLNAAWNSFWKAPQSYQAWEANAVAHLFAYCEGEKDALCAI
jgi:hypothetical protein